MTEKYDDVIHGAFGDFTEDAESTITSRGSGDVRSKVQRRRRLRLLIITLVLMAAIAVVATFLIM